jgi:putative endonuclease
VLERNVRTPYGEIDIIARQEFQNLDSSSGASQVIVFIEVKTRSTRAFGPPEGSITQRKQEHMLAAAQSYLQEHPELDGDWRIDVIAIARYRPERKVEIYHFENAVQ